MKLVVDSNILFTFFWKDSVFAKLSMRQDLELLAPEYALQEINKYAEEIIRKARISKEEFKKVLNEMGIVVEFISFDEYKNFLKGGLKITKDMPKNEEKEILEDLDFLALALKLNCQLWSNDSLLKKQKSVEVLATKEIIEVLG